MGNYSILYVDDEEINLRGFESLFEDDYDIHTAISGQEAIKILETEEVHLVITDQKMPKMTGVEFLMAIKDTYPNIIRIILTGFSDINAIITGVNECGIYRYLTKPWKTDEMSQVLEQALETFQLRKDNTYLFNQLQEINGSLEEQVKNRTHELHIKNEDIQASLAYAQKIQEAVLPQMTKIKTLLPNSFIFFKPKDIVSGDFYWVEEKEGKLIVITADCTGHGVPGAFMSMIGHVLLSEIIMQQGIIEPHLILKQLNSMVHDLLKQKETHNEDGMDIGVVVIDKATHQLKFSGAFMNLLFFQENERFLLEGNKTHIGGFRDEREKIFSLKSLDISKPTHFYLFSDGFQDQFGGPRHKRFMRKQLRELLHSIHLLPMEEQKTRLHNRLKEWMLYGNQEQIDDILVMGFKV